MIFVFSLPYDEIVFILCCLTCIKIHSHGNHRHTICKFVLKWYQWYVIGRFCNLFCLLHCRNWKSMALMSVCNCVISVKKCFLSSNNGFLRFCQGKTQVPIKNYILNSTNRITTVLCQKCIAQQAHIIRASTLHPSSTILLLSYIFLCEQILRKM